MVGKEMWPAEANKGGAHLEGPGLEPFLIAQCDELTTNLAFDSLPRTPAQDKQRGREPFLNISVATIYRSESHS